jgi:hypothetical protein
MATSKTQKHSLSSHEVMGLKEHELVGKLKAMTTSTIMKEMGSAAYAANMTRVMQALKEAPASENRFQTVQKTLEELLPNKAYFSDIYARLAAIVMMIISRKFQALL